MQALIRQTAERILRARDGDDDARETTLEDAVLLAESVIAAPTGFVNRLTDVINVIPGQQRYGDGGGGQLLRTPAVLRDRLIAEIDVAQRGLALDGTDEEIADNEQYALAATAIQALAEAADALDAIEQRQPRLLGPQMTGLAGIEIDVAKIARDVWHAAQEHDVTAGIIIDGQQITPTVIADVAAAAVTHVLEHGPAQ